VPGRYQLSAKRGRFDKEKHPMVSHERIYQLIRKDKREAAIFINIPGTTLNTENGL